MKNRISIILLIAIYFGCQKNETMFTSIGNIAVINASATFDLKKYANSQISIEESEIIDHILKNVVEKYNSSETARLKLGGFSESKIDLKNYKRQYVPYINSNGEKEIWIYCMHEHFAHKSWKNEVLFAAGGGCNFFQITINPKTKSYRKLFVNGPA
jgi:hypothetical protein